MTVKKLLATFYAIAGLEGVLVVTAWLVGPLAGGAVQGVLTVAAVVNGIAAFGLWGYIEDSDLPWDRRARLERSIDALERWHAEWEARPPR